MSSWAWSCVTRSWEEASEGVMGRFLVVLEKFEAVDWRFLVWAREEDMEMKTGELGLTAFLLIFATAPIGGRLRSSIEAGCSKA